MTHEPKFKNIIWLDLQVQQKIIEEAKKYGVATNVYIAKILTLAVMDKEFMKKADAVLNEIFAKNFPKEAMRKRLNQIVNQIKESQIKGQTKVSRLALALKVGFEPSEQELKKLADYGVIVGFDDEWVYLE